MFTRGFKLFFGFALAAFVAALVYGFSSGDTTGPNYFGVLDRDAFQGIISLGWRGGVGQPIGYVTFIILAATTAFLGLTMVAFRDADPESVAELSPDGELAPAQGPTATSWWPLAGAVGVGMFIVGIATSTAVWGLGIGILAVVAFEWAMTAWGDRATGDPEVNTELRRSVMGPIEIPVLATAIVAIVGIAISRIFLAVSAAWAVWVAVIVAGVILAVGAWVASRPQYARGVVAGVVGLTAVGIMTAGIISAAVGEREIEHHGEHHGEEHHDDEEHHDEETSLGPVIVLSAEGVTE